MYDTLVKAWAHWGDYLENLFTRERSVIVLFVLGGFYYYFIHQFVYILCNFSYTGASDTGDIKRLLELGWIQLVLSLAMSTADSQASQLAALKRNYS